MQRSNWEVGIKMDIGSLKDRDERLRIMSSFEKS
jgi:hypothetical protein